MGDQKLNRGRTKMVNIAGVAIFGSMAMVLRFLVRIFKFCKKRNVEILVKRDKKLIKLYKNHIRLNLIDQIYIKIQLLYDIEMIHIT